MATDSLPKFAGYESKTFVFKTVDKIEIKLDALFPTEPAHSPTPVVVHYHGGFLILGDRYSIPPYWLIQACILRKWIFVSPDYRLAPEATAHEAVDDAIDAYNWVSESLGDVLGITTGPVALAGSSAGGYLALTTAALSTRKPKAVVSLYGLLDLADKRYATKGLSIFGVPPFETKPVLERFPPPGQLGATPMSGYAWPEDSAKDERFALIVALHLEALYPDYVVGVAGLSQSIAAKGPDAIPETARRLFPGTFGYPSDLPPVILVHGKDDAAVPVHLSESTANRLRQVGARVTAEFPDNAQHGFDVALGPVSIEEESSVAKSPAVDSLRKIVKFLDQELSGA